MVNCQGCGEETLSRLCCPKCSEYGRTSFFCSQDCFVNSWPSHSKLHVIIRQIALSNNASSYEACSSQSLNAEETAAASPATTAASVSANGEESFLGKKSQSASTGAQLLEPHSRSRILSRAGSETELPVVMSSASSSSFSRLPSAADASSSVSSSSRGGGPPSLSPVGVAPAEEETAGHSVSPNARRDSPDEGSGTGGVFTAVRSLLLPKTREKTEDKTAMNRSAASAAAVRVSQAMRSVFSTSHNRHHAVPCSNRKKGAGRALPGREASGRTGAPSSSAAVPPAGVGFCRCVVLAVICTFSLFFMWMMRRILFDASSSSSAYHGARPDAGTPNRSEALSDSDDIISAVLARLGARPYGEEISALQASIQDIRNELAAVTTLVQQHGAVIDQFVDKPNFSGRRQGGAGGAINQAISAFLEGGPPLPETPQLKLPVLRPSAGIFTRKGAFAGLSETMQQAAVANPHAAVRRGETLAIDETEDASVGMSPQKFYEANVAVEGDRVKSAATEQQPPSENTKAQQLQEDGRQEHANKGVGRFNGVSADSVYLTGSLVNAAVKSASTLSEQGDKVSDAKSMLQPKRSEEASVGTSVLYAGGNTQQTINLDIGRAEQREKPTRVSDTEANKPRSALTYTHAPSEEKDEAGERLQRYLGGEDPRGSSDSGGRHGIDRPEDANVDKSEEAFQLQFLRGKGERQQRIRRKEEEEEQEKENPAASQGNQEELGQMTESPQSRSFGLAGVRSRNLKRVKTN